MNSFQKTIKYAAIGLAIFLSIGIIAGLGAVGYGIYHAINYKTTTSDTISVSELDTYFIEGSQNAKSFTTSYSRKNINNIYITSDIGNIFIQPGDSFQIEANNIDEGFSSFIDGDYLFIENSSNISNFFPFYSEGTTPTIILTLPSNFCAEEISIENGSGTLQVEGLNTDYLYLSTGTSKTNFFNSYAEEVTIEEGIGSSIFENCNFTDLNMICGVGTTQFSGNLSGNCYIEGGVGKIDFYLNNAYRDFEIDLSTGLGSTKINGKNYRSDTLLNEDAPNELIISSGVGSISIDFKH